MLASTIRSPAMAIWRARAIVLTGPLSSSSDSCCVAEKAIVAGHVVDVKIPRRGRSEGAHEDADDSKPAKHGQHRIQLPIQHRKNVATRATKGGPVSGENMVCANYIAFHSISPSNRQPAGLGFVAPVTWKAVTASQHSSCAFGLDAGPSSLTYSDPECGKIGTIGGFREALTKPQESPGHG